MEQVSRSHPRAAVVEIIRDGRDAAAVSPHVPRRSLSWVGERLEPAQWYAGLPTFLASASALITDHSGSAVLAVKPNYRPWWNLPGGIMEAGEPPHLCCIREVAEELGFKISLGRLLVIDWVPPNAMRKAWFGYVFDGGVLDDLSRISLQTEELDGFAFIGQARTCCGSS
jgi:8-oxo-dGTP pyrophosphatase MutT (NUDIX family)